MKPHLTLVPSAPQPLPPAGDVPIPLPPLPQPDAAGRAHLSVPADAKLKAWSRDHDAAVFQHPTLRWEQDAPGLPVTRSAAWCIQVGGCAAPLQHHLVDMACALVVEVSIGNLPINSAKRIVSMMPSPFATKREG